METPSDYNCPKCENKNVEIYPEKDIYKHQFRGNDQNFFNNNDAI